MYQDPEDQTMTSTASLSAFFGMEKQDLSKDFDPELNHHLRRNIRVNSVTGPSQNSRRKRDPSLVPVKGLGRS